MVIGGVLSIAIVVLVLFALSYSPYNSALLFYGYGFLEQANYL
jgi:hypothetical protein